MRKEITFFAVDGLGNRMRRVTVSRHFLMALFFLACCCAGLLAIEIRGLIRSSFLAPENDRLRQEIAELNQEVERQRRHIGEFAGQINSLKGRLARINQFENRIRILANLNTPDNSSTYLGVGGALPSDIDPRKSLRRDQNSLMREMHQQIDHLAVVSATQESDLHYLLRGIREKRGMLAATPSIRPLDGNTTSRFGMRQSPFTGLTEFHTGLDIAAPSGAPILATADGTVTFAGNKGHYGKIIIIHHGHGMVTRYAHVSEFLKKPGDTVRRGDAVALVGNTGRTTGPHLHYEVRINGTATNPSDYILN